jgi:hypothetical protein
MPPELEGSSAEVVVLSNEFFVEGHWVSCLSRLEMDVRFSLRRSPACLVER